MSGIFRNRARYTARPHRHRPSSLLLGPISASITSPAAGSTIALAPTVVTGSISSSAGSITRAKLRVNGSDYALDLDSPWAWFWSPSAAGTYTLAIHATDSAGNTKVSHDVVVTVTDVSVLRFPVQPVPGVKEADIVIAGTPYDLIDGGVYADGTTSPLLATFYDPDYYADNFSFEAGIIKRSTLDALQVSESWEGFSVVTDFLGVNGWGGMTLQETLHPTGADAAGFGYDVMSGTDTFDVNRVEPSSLRSRFGTKSLRVSCEAASASPTITKATISNVLIHAAQGNSIHASFWLYIEDGTPLGIIDFENSFAADGPGIRLLLNTSFVPRLECKFFDKPTYAASAAIPTDQWVHLLMEIGLHPSTGYARLWADGKLLINATGQTLPTPNIVYDRVQVGVSANSEATAVLLYIDELRVWTRPQASPHRSTMLTGMGV